MKTLFVIALLMGGLAHAGSPLDVQCDKVGNFARGIAVVRATGVTEGDIESYISQPMVQPYPLTWIRHQIYANGLLPDQAYIKFYSTCVLVGATNILQYAKDQDTLVQLVEENRKLKSENAQLKSQVAQIEWALEHIQTKEKIVLVPTYGTPIDSK